MFCKHLLNSQLHGIFVLLSQVCAATLAFSVHFIFYFPVILPYAVPSFRFRGPSGCEVEGRRVRGPVMRLFKRRGVSPPQLVRLSPLSPEEECERSCNAASRGANLGHDNAGARNRTSGRARHARSQSVDDYQVVQAVPAVVVDDGLKPRKGEPCSLYTCLLLPFPQICM